MRNTAAKEIMEYCKAHKDGFLIAGDAGFGVWDSFQKEFPSQYINTGINEQATIGLASGMALCGHKVFYYNIIPFVLMRCYEQVRLDICYQNLPVVLIGIGSGITYAPAGMTHYSVEDIALARTVPNLTIISPSDPVQTSKAIKYAISNNQPTYIRLSRSGEPIVFDENIDISKPIFLRKGTKRAIVFHGSIIDEILKIFDELNDIAVISIPMIHPLDSFELEQILSCYETIYVVEEHFENGGLGTILVDFANEHNIAIKIKKIGIKNQHIHQVGNCSFLRELFKLDSKSILDYIKGSK